jgi:hypothetical protein
MQRYCIPALLCTPSTAVHYSAMGSTALAESVEGQACAAACELAVSVDLVQSSRSLIHLLIAVDTLPWGALLLQLVCSCLAGTNTREERLPGVSQRLPPSPSVSPCHPVSHSVSHMAAQQRC